MLDSLLTSPYFKLAATAFVVVIVLLTDFSYRRDVYNRSDPLSFSILGYSVLLITPTVFLRFLDVIKIDSNTRLIQIDWAPISVLLFSACFYFALLFIIFSFLKKDHNVREERPQGFFRGARTSDYELLAVASSHGHARRRAACA